jgi:hypothetical protein
MKTRSLRAMAVACAMAALAAVPYEVLAEPQTAGQRAEEVWRVIPAVSIVRGSESLSASAKTVVVRSQAQRITQPNGKFEVQTAVGVAGVVGTDFNTAYDNNVMTVIVFAFA